MKKRLFAMLLTLCMVMALLPTAVFAEESAGSEETFIEVADAESLQTAVNNAADNTTVYIKLTGDIDAGENCVLALTQFKDESYSFKSVFLDLNGHNITSAAECTFLIEVNNSLNIQGKGTISNTCAENAATFRNYGNLYLSVMFDEEWNAYAPSVVSAEGNSALQNWGNADIVAEEITGYVDNYSALVVDSTLRLFDATLHHAVRSHIDSESARKIPGKISISGATLKGGAIYDFDEEELDAELVTVPTAYITIANSNVRGSLTPVGNATFEVGKGTFEYPVAEDLLCKTDDAEYVCVARKDSMGKTYYSVLKASNKTFGRIAGQKIEAGVPVQELEPIIARAGGSFEISFSFGISEEERYAAENTTVNGIPVTIEEDEDGDRTIYAVVTLAGGDNRFEIKSKATNGTEYTYYLTVSVEAEEGEEPYVEVGSAVELQDAVADNIISYIKLTDDIDTLDYYALSVPAGKRVTIDLNGHNISSAAEYTIKVERSERNRGELTIKGAGTISNTAEECSAAIYNCGTLKMTYTMDEERNLYCPSVANKDGNVAIENHGYATVSVEEVTGYVDSYGGRVSVMGIFHDKIRSYVDEEGYPAKIDVSGVDTVLKGGVAFNFSAEDIAEYVTEKEVYISISGATVMGELKAVGNATIEVSSGNFEQPVAEEYLYTYEHNDGTKDERVCIERKDAEGKTYYSVLQKTNRSIARIHALLYTFWTDESSETSQDFGAKSAFTNKVVEIRVGGVEAFPTAEELYAMENTTINGKLVTIAYNSSGYPTHGSVELTLEPGENKVEVKSKATDGTEYTFIFTLVLDAATENPDPKPETPPTPSKPTVPTIPSTPTTGTVTKPDGSTVTTERDDNGSKSETVVDKNGIQTTEVTVSNAAVREAVAAGKPVALPMPAATATKDSATAPTVTIDLPYGVKRATVEIPVENVTAGTVAVIVHADGTEEVVRTSVPTEDGIALSVESGATVKIVDNSRDFGDVAANHTFNEAIDFASARGIIEGYGDGSFAPGNLATSNAVVTVVSRIMGNDFYGSGATVKANDWAKENGITLGLDMSGNITRGSFMTMLWRAAGCPVSSEADTAFADASSLNDVEKAAFAWAVENGVINGYGDGTVRPDAGITRGAMAAIAQRYMTAE